MPTVNAVEELAYAPYKELEGHVLGLIARGDDVAGVLAELDDRGDMLMIGDDLDGLLRFSADVDRLFRNLKGTRSPELLGEARGALRSLLRRLDHAAATMRQAADVEQRAAEAEGVRPQVLELLRGGAPLRSGDIARSLAIAPSQVSRALRELRDSGAVTLAEAPAGADRRARFYVAGAVATSHAA